MKEGLIRFIKQNPLLAAIIVLVLVATLYFLFNALWAGGKIWLLERENEKLANDVLVLDKKKDELEIKVANRDGVIEIKDKEIEEKNALLQAISAKTVASRENLDKATDTAARIMGDDSPLSRDELRAKLCVLYNIPPSACK
jgi:hypothetical protein